MSFSEERFPPYVSPRFFLRLEVYDVTKREALFKISFVGSLIKYIWDGIIVNVDVVY